VHEDSYCTRCERDSQEEGRHRHGSAVLSRFFLYSSTITQHRSVMVGSGTDVSYFVKRRDT
jgi:hypothetical protein